MRPTFARSLKQLIRHSNYYTNIALFQNEFYNV